MYFLICFVSSQRITYAICYGEENISKNVGTLIKGLQNNLSMQFYNSKIRFDMGRELWKGCRVYQMSYLTIRPILSVSFRFNHHFVQKNNINNFWASFLIIWLPIYFIDNLLNYKRCKLIGPFSLNYFPVYTHYQIQSKD